MAVATLKPNERYGIVGKTRSGKTYLAMVLASYFAQQLHSPWEIWWMDTKGSAEDIDRLRAWGFCNGSSPKDMARPGGLRNALYFIINDKNGFDVVDQVQYKCQEAYERGHVIVVIDEYTECVPSNRNPGPGLRNIFSRGGGKNVGLIGLTQEPVYVPRMLLSQASHLVLFTVTFEADKKYLKNLYKDYVPPKEKGDPHGFYWSHIDGSANWAYYSNQKEWDDTVKYALPRPPKAVPEDAP